MRLITDKKQLNNKNQQFKNFNRLVNIFSRSGIKSAKLRTLSAYWLKIY